MWDDEIDAVARRLTAAAPPAHLRARVMARIADEARPRRSWRLWWLMVPAAASAALVVALVVPNHRRAEIGPALARGAGERHAVPPPAPALDVTASAGSTPQRFAAPRQRVTGNLEEPERLASLPQLDGAQVSALELEPIQVRTIPPLTRIDVARVAMAPLPFVPLTPDDQR